MADSTSALITTSGKLMQIDVGVISRLSSAARYMRPEGAEQLAWPKAALLIFLVSIAAWAAILALFIWL
ncbi:hypothetical protein [Acidiphilium multivorum]|uniref:hypothetical protein n=1 Tax=Acidiphilium multivorum TaxID=62140 RepID=UPI0012B52B2B|nr:hypothetical protein [Acidiphilium multivorum]